MLIYEKVVKGKRKFFGSLTDIPSEKDKQITFKDSSGKSIKNIEEYNLYCKDDGVFATPIKSNNQDDTTIQVTAWLGKTLLFGKTDKK